MSGNRRTTSIVAAAFAIAVMIFPASADPGSIAASQAPVEAQAGQVNVSDLNDWRSNYGTSPAAATDGDVDGRDFLVWQRNTTP